MEESVAAARHFFKDKEYYVSLSVENGNLLKVQIEDESTGEQWVGKFSAKYIEDLTYKTGNFKEFKIFNGMLESALEKTSDSIILELKTYADLESIRNQNVKASKSVTDPSVLNTRRYLIMTYTVEFDRIHYPLSLHYVGKFDPASLRKLLREQKEEIDALKLKLRRPSLYYASKRPSLSPSSKRPSLIPASQRPSSQPSSKPQEERHNKHQDQHQDLDKDQHPDVNTEKLLQEKSALYAELEMSNEAFSRSGIARELRILQRVIEGLESELLKQRSQHKHLLFKKAAECKRLANELEGVRASERHLKHRVESLTNELTILRGDPTANRRMKMPVYADRWSKKQVNQGQRGRGASTERRYRTPSPAGYRFNPTAYIEEKRKREEEGRRSSAKGMNRAKSVRRSSFDRLTPATSSKNRERRPTSRRRFNASGNSSNTVQRSRSASFDRLTPVTSSQSTGKRLSSKRRSNDSETSLHRRRTSSVGSSRSGFSSADSGSERGHSKARRITTDSVTRTVSASSITKKGLRKSRPVITSDGSDLEAPKNRKFKSPFSKNRANTTQKSNHKAPGGTEGDNDNALNIKQIDARLNALQRFMKDSQP